MTKAELRQHEKNNREYARLNRAVGFITAYNPPK